MPEQYAHSDLTGKIIGVLFDTYNELGFGYQEKYYYRAIKIKLVAQGLAVAEQLLSRIVIENKVIGKYYLDFLVEKCVVLEIKVADRVYNQHIRQVLGYLKANNLKVGIIGVFSPHGMLIKRVINSLISVSVVSVISGQYEARNAK